MKKYLLFAALSLGLSYANAASQKTTSGREFESYQDTSECMWYAEGITSASAGTVSTVTVPSCAKGFRMYPVSTAIQFNVGIANDSQVEAIGTAAAGVEITTTTLNVGNYAVENTPEIRLLPCTGSSSGCTQRYIWIRSTGTSVTYRIEFF